jgi:HAD superfamily hydrolase (TIGR01509 family)
LTAHLTFPSIGWLDHEPPVVDLSGGRPVSEGLAAVLFDLDGLLVDTEPQWLAAEVATVTELGGTWTKRNQLDLLGTNLDFAARYMIEATGSDRSVVEVIELLEDNMSRRLEASVTLRPGAQQLLTEVQSSDLLVGLVTSSVRVHVDVMLQQLPVDVFDVVVCADDVERLKPDPLPYTTALGKLAVAPETVVVLEDSPVGVTAAEAAGCRVVAVPSVAPVDEAPGRIVIGSLEDVDLDLLRSLVT